MYMESKIIDGHQEQQYAQYRVLRQPNFQLTCGRERAVICHSECSIFQKSCKKKCSLFHKLALFGGVDGYVLVDGVIYTLCMKGHCNLQLFFHKSRLEVVVKQIDILSCNIALLDLKFIACGTQYFLRLKKVFLL